MAVKFTMPQLGLTMTEGTVSKWHKKVGDPVKIGEMLVEISTDKITNEMESTGAGTILDILVQEGGTAPVKAVFAIIGEAGEKLESATASAPAENAAAPVSAAPSATTSGISSTSGASTVVGDDGWVKASPAARKMANDNNIDIALVTATGPDGRVVERDILAFAASAPAAVKTSPLAAKVAADLGVDVTGIVKAGRIMKDDVLAAAKPAAASVPAKKTPLVGIRKVIAERMSQSWNIAPHVHHTVEVDMTEALQLKDQLAKASGEKASVTEIVIKCAAQVLKEIPLVNASIEGNQIVYHDSVNMGVAVALDNGLIVPVIRDAGGKSLREIRAAVVDLGAKARTNKLLPDEISGGTFTVTNLGMFGTDHFTPIINQPESAIMAVCRTVEKPVVIAGQIVIRPMCNFVLGYDHRLIDGAVAAKFMARFRELIEKPFLLLVG